MHELGAGPRLIHHHRLVVDAATQLVVGLEPYRAAFDPQRVLLGAAIHDAGKICCPAELLGGGNEHERLGAELLRANGMSGLARFCVTHGQWRDRDLPVEDLLVALADTLWKGRRSAELEERLGVQVATASGHAYWDLMIPLDDLFERIAAEGPTRLMSSAEVPIDP